jgi:hypothetical protein
MTEQHMLDYIAMADLLDMTPNGVRHLNDVGALRERAHPLLKPSEPHVEKQALDEPVAAGGAHAASLADIRIGFQNSHRQVLDIIARLEI